MYRTISEAIATLTYQIGKIDVDIRYFGSTEISDYRERQLNFLFDKRIALMDQLDEANRCVAKAYMERQMNAR